MSEPPAGVYNARLSPARRLVSIPDGFGNGWIVAIGVFLAATLSAPSRADPPDISAQRLLMSWQGDDPGMRMLAEVIASAFASGFSWGADAAGKQVYCAPPDAKGREIMNAFEAFVRDHPQLSGEPYGAAMAATLSGRFPCSGK